MKNRILTHLPGDFPWQVHWFEQVTSTNDVAKEMAKNGAPHGTAVLAGFQSAGRGRMGHSFSSPAGTGIYLSVILRPECPAQKLMHLTCGVGTLMCDAMQSVTGIRPKLKWINDLILDQKKLGGILTELSLGKDGLVDFAVIGIGINCNQQKTDFPQPLQETAVSLKMHTGKEIDQAALAAGMLMALYHADLPEDAAKLMAAYRKDCMTIGRSVTVLQAPDPYCAVAIDVEDTGALLVKTQDGSVRKIQSGEVSIRGTDGYV